MKRAEIGIELVRARRKAGLNQSDVARAMGTSQSAVARAEAGWVQPTLDFIERFARVTRQPLRLGSLLVWADESRPEQEETKRLRRIRSALGDFEFDPWLRDPTPAEQRSLLADGLTRERFESASTPSTG
jgi:transcriptional regulator with XRE-family HTH domain